MADRQSEPIDPEPSEPNQRLAQVRDLLFGETARSLDERVERLAQNLEEAERSLRAKTEALDAQLEALSAASVDRQTLAETLRKLADAVEGKATARSRNG